MKTVMKKIFCLMLVAVLMVGVMPFQAFAAEAHTVHLVVNYGSNVLTKDLPEPDVGPTINDYLYWHFDPNWASSYTLSSTNINGYAATLDTATSATDINSAGVINIEINLAAGTCSNCGRSAHTGPCCSKCHVTTHADADHCSICNGLDHAAADHCQYNNCGMVGAHITNCRYYCNGKADCPNDRVADAHNEGCLKLKCNLNGCSKDYGHGDEHNVPCTQAGCILNLGHTGDHNTPCTTAGCTLGYNHTEKHHSNVCGPCGLAKIKSPEHKAECDYYYVNAEPTVTVGTSTLTVYANLYTGSVKTGTMEIAKYENISSETVVYTFLSDREAELRSRVPSGYGWTGHVYNADNKNIAEVMNTRVGTGRTVHINLYSDADYVYIYVHTNKSFANDRVIQMDGKKVNESITKSEVTNLVDNYYALNSLKMYTKDGWSKYVNGNTVQDVATVTAVDGITEVHVLISGATHSTSSTVKADSSNPKTGDMVFAPVAVLGLSASALAVLFFLNKKRAF